MSLHTIGGLYPSFTVNKSMDIFGRERKDHVRKIEKNWRGRIGTEDTVIIIDDHSRGQNLEETLADSDFIQSLPGREVLLRGDHNIFRDTKETYRLDEMFQGRLFFPQNNYYIYGEYTPVGTKGYCREGKDSPEHFERPVKRELEWSRISSELAAVDGCSQFVVFLHCPPTSIGEMESGFTEMVKEYGAEQVVYSYCYGEARHQDSFPGEVDGIEYKLVSSGCFKFRPEKILR